MKQPAAHISEIKTFLGCRLKWFWTAPPPRGLGLESRVPAPPLGFGSFFHAALQEGYDTGRDFESAFVESYDKFLAELKDYKGTLFLEHIPDLEAGRDLGAVMMRNYKPWADVRDKDTQFLATETPWGIKIGRVRLSGTFDAVVKRPDGLWVMDFKTTKYTVADWVDRDLQGTAYTYAARQLFGPDVRGVIFRFMLKKAPLTYDKLILKNGTLTTRKNLSAVTSLEEWNKAMAVVTLKNLVLGDFIFAAQVGLDIDTATGEDYLALLVGDYQEQEWYPRFNEDYTNVRRLYYSQTMSVRGESRYYWDIETFRTDRQLKNYFKFIILPAIKEMTSRRKGRWVGPTGLGVFGACRNCTFKAPCGLVCDGADYRTILREEYQLRDIYRKDYEEEVG